jgi:hypothetical protein
MDTMIRPQAKEPDEHVCEMIGRHAAAHHLRAEKLQYAIEGSTAPVDEDIETTSEISGLLKMAQPNLDGDEQEAIHRLETALEAGEAHAGH